MFVAFSVPGLIKWGLGLFSNFPIFPPQMKQIADGIQPTGAAVVAAAASEGRRVRFLLMVPAIEISDTAKVIRKLQTMMMGGAGGPPPGGR
jgi:hypothetical protein